MHFGQSGQTADVHLPNIGNSLHKLVTANFAKLFYFINSFSLISARVVLRIHFRCTSQKTNQSKLFSKLLCVACVQLCFYTMSYMGSFTDLVSEMCASGSDSVPIVYFLVIFRASRLPVFFCKKNNIGCLDFYFYQVQKFCSSQKLEHPQIEIFESKKVGNFRQNPEIFQSKINENRKSRKLRKS